jgi:hypothetical protein
MQAEQMQVGQVQAGQSDQAGGSITMQICD